MFSPAELLDSSTFKRFSNSIDGILENLEDVDFSVMGTQPPQIRRLRCTCECVREGVCVGPEQAEVDLVEGDEHSSDKKMKLI